MSIRNVRNFYMTGSVDGYQSDLSAGPTSKYGGMSIDITQRNDGSVDTAISIRCYRHLIFTDSGEEIVRLITSVRDKDGNEVYRYETVR